MKDFYTIIKTINAPVSGLCETLVTMFPPFIVSYRTPALVSTFCGGPEFLFNLFNDCAKNEFQVASMFCDFENKAKNKFSFV